MKILLPFPAEDDVGDPDIDQLILVTTREELVILAGGYGRPARQWMSGSLTLCSESLVKRP